MRNHTAGLCVLAALEGTEADTATMEAAVREAAWRNAPLHVVQVIEPPAVPHTLDPDLAQRVLHDSAKHAWTTLEATVDKAVAGHPGLRVRTRVLVGPTVQTLLDHAHMALLLVLGASPLTGGVHRSLGRVAVHLTTHARSPVLVVRPAQGTDPARRNAEGHVVVGVDGSEVSTDALAFAFEEASWRRTGLTVVHAWQDVITGPMLRRGEANPMAEEAGCLLAESLAGWTEKYPDVEVMRRVVQSEPAHALLTASRRAGLVVVGSHGRGRFRGMLLGSVSQAVLQRASTDVAVVRGA